MNTAGREERKVDIVRSVAAGGNPAQKRSYWVRSMPQHQAFFFQVADWKAFSAERYLRPFAKEHLVLIRSDACQVGISLSGIHMADGLDLALHFLIDGEMVFTQEGVAITLRPGDVLVVDSTRLHRLQTGASHRFLMLPVSRASLGLGSLPTSQHSPLFLPGASPAAAVANGLVRLAWSKAPVLNEAAGQALQNNLLSTVASGLTDTSASNSVKFGSAHVGAMLTRARALVLENVQDPGLSSTSLSVMMGVSPRYLSALFETLGISPNNLILRIRMHLAWDRLSDPFDTAPIEKIGRDLGFTQAAHFSRCVKREYGLTPREIRRSMDSPPPSRRPE